MSENKELLEIIEIAKTTDRLMKNRDFKKIVSEFYIKGGSEMLVKNLTKANNEDVRNDIIKQMEARSYLQRFLDDIMDRGYEAADVLVEDEEQGE